MRLFVRFLRNQTRPEISLLGPAAARECLFCNSIQEQQTTYTKCLLTSQTLCLILPRPGCTNLTIKQQQKTNGLTCNALGQRQLSWCAVVISLLCAVAAVVPLIPPTPPPLLLFTSDSSGAAISVDTVGHILYPSGLIANHQATTECWTNRIQEKIKKEEVKRRMRKWGKWLKRLQ